MNWYRLIDKKRESKLGARFWVILVFVLMISWIFLGWPQILGFPPKIQDVLAAAPHITVSDAADGATQTVAPGSLFVEVGRYAMVIDKTSGSCTSSIFTFPANIVAGIAAVEVWNVAGTTQYFATQTSPTGDTFVLSGGTPITVTTTLTEYYIYLQPKSHANMPAPNGASYAAQANITSLACDKGFSGGDSFDQIITIDNLSANPATSTTGSVTTDTSITIGWTTSSSSDYNRSVVLRWAASTPGAEVPAEGSTYSLDESIGAAKVACIENTGTSSTAYSGVDGSGADECSTVALTASTQYSYKHFERDDNGNWDTGTVNADSPLTTTGGADTTSFADASTNNSTVTIAPGASATDTGRFDIQDSGGGGSTVTSITVTFPANVVAGIAKVAVWNAGESTEYLSATSPTSDTFVLTTGTAIPTTSSAVEFHILVTPKSHGNMAAPNGASYAATAHVTAATCAIAGGCNTFGDSADNTVTIDNLSANPATSTTGSVTTDTSITIGWTTSSSSDYNRSVVLRWTASTPGAEVPAEGSTYSLDQSIGAAKVACIENTGTASTAYSGVDGSGADECSTSALTASTQYSYKHFEQDDNGNWDTGTTNANSPLTTTGAPTLTFTISDVVVGFGALDSGNARYASSDGTGASSEEEAHNITASTNGTNGYSLTVNGTTLTSNTDTITAIGAANTASSTGSEQFGLRMTATGGNGSVTAPYAASGFALDIAAFPDEVASDADGDDVTTTYSVRYLANIHVNTEAGSYSSTLTFILSANF